MLPYSAVLASVVYIPPGDPYSANVLGYLLRLPLLLDALSAELSLTRLQEDALAEIVRELNAPADLPMAHFSFTTEEVDANIRQHLSPFQYLRFRDWIVQQWGLEKGEVGPSVEVLANMNEHTLRFLKGQLSLPPDISQRIASNLAEYQRHLLALRQELLVLANNPLITWNELELEGRKIIEKIAEIAKYQTETIMRELTSEQKEQLQALMETK